MNTVTTTTPGGESITTTVTVTRTGQDLPSQSDRVCVTCEVAVWGGAYSIPAAARFRSRVSVAGEYLTDNWGEAYDGARGQYRFKDRPFYAQTWAKAEADAYAWGDAEAAKLHDALKARAKALADAGT